MADQIYKKGKAEKDLIVERMKERRSRRMAGAFLLFLWLFIGGKVGYMWLFG